MMLLLCYIFFYRQDRTKEEDSLVNKEEIELVDTEETLGPKGIDVSVLLIAELMRRRRTSTYLTTSMRSAQAILLDHAQEECQVDP